MSCNISFLKHLLKQMTKDMSTIGYTYHSQIL